MGDEEDGLKWAAREERRLKADDILLVEWDFSWPERLEGKGLDQLQKVGLYTGTVQESFTIFRYASNGRED